jgi:hypothetical protein
VDLTCKDCGKSGFGSAWAVKRHKEDVHGAAPRAAGKTTARRGSKRGSAAAGRRSAKPAARAPRAPGERAAPQPPAEPTVDAEASLLYGCLNLFANAGTDANADFRVLEYLALRFGPAAYEEGDADETASE